MDLPSEIPFNEDFADMGYEKSYVLVLMYYVFIAVMWATLRFAWLKYKAKYNRRYSVRKAAKQ
jgi:hypothetical protein